MRRIILFLYDLFAHLDIYHSPHLARFERSSQLHHLLSPLRLARCSPHLLLLPAETMAKPSLSAATGKPADFRKVSAPSKPAEEDDEKQGNMKAKEEEEEDYMSMALPTTTTTTSGTTGHHHNETYTQRRERKAREAEAAQPRSKTELAAAASAARDAGLATSLAPDSRGAKMLAKLGYTPGEALGARGNVHAKVEPLVVEVKEGREGVGMEGERKRKVREEMEEVVGREKRVKA